MSHPILIPLTLRPLKATPRVSILISNYNYAEYIEQALTSALAQTYGDLEVVVCDDGSTDGSCDVIAQYCRYDPRVRLLRKKNGGQASGFNAAFSACTGDLVFLLDSDDIFLPAKVASMVRAHQFSPDAGLGVHRMLYVTKAGRPRGVYPLRPSLPHGWCGNTLLRTGGVLPCMPPTSGLSLHRSVAERIFPLPENFRLNADQAITRLASLLTPIVKCDATLAQYRVHGGNGYAAPQITTATLLKEMATSRELWKLQHDFLGTIDPALASALAPIHRSSYYIYLLYLYSRLSRSPMQRSAYLRFLADLRKSHSPRLRFWASSFYMPVFFFQGMVDVINRPGIVKQIVARWRGLNWRSA